MTATQEFTEDLSETFRIMPEILLGITSGILFMIIPTAFIALGLGLSGKLARNLEGAF